MPFGGAVGNGPVGRAAGGALSGFGPIGAAVGGGLGFLSGLLGGNEQKQPADLRLPPTIIDFASQAGLNGADRSAFLGPLMPLLREKLFSAFGGSAPKDDLFSRILTERMANPIGNEAALGGSPMGADPYADEKAKTASYMSKLNAGGPNNPYTTKGADGLSQAEKDIAEINAQDRTIHDSFKNPQTKYRTTAAVR
jgi:hypothetical protein